MNPATLRNIQILRYVLRDPFVQGFITGVAAQTFFSQYIGHQSVASPKMQLHLPTDEIKKLMDGETLRFDSRLGELMLLRAEVD